MTAPVSTSKRPAPEPEFDEPSHTYRLAGRLLVPVSSILDWGGLKGFGGGGGHGSRLPALIGTAAHKAIALDMRGRLRESSVDRRVMPYVLAARAMAKETGLWRWSSELMVWSEAMGVAGTLDLVASLLDLPTKKDKWLLDWKTGAKADWHAVQTAAYSWLLQDRTLRRGAVYLREDGTYKLDAHEDPLDYTAWEGAMSVAAWRVKRNLVT